MRKGKREKEERRGERGGRIKGEKKREGGMKMEELSGRKGRRQTGSVFEGTWADLLQDIERSIHNNMDSWALSSTMIWTPGLCPLFCVD